MKMKYIERLIMKIYNETKIDTEDPELYWAQIKKDIEDRDKYKPCENEDRDKYKPFVNEWERERAFFLKREAKKREWESLKKQVVEELVKKEKENMIILSKSRSKMTDVELGIEMDKDLDRRLELELLNNLVLIGDFKTSEKDVKSAGERGFYLINLDKNTVTREESIKRLKKLLYGRWFY